MLDLAGRDRSGATPEITLAIMSRGRAEPDNRVCTTHLYYENSLLCVSESEAPMYREAYGNDVEIVVHPDSIIGVNPKRQWMFEYFGDVLILGDDLGPLFSQVTGPGDSVEYHDPKTCYDIVQHIASCAWEAGAYMFAWSASADIRNHNPMMPFRLTGYVQGNVGLFKGWKGWFPDDPYFTAGDYFACAINAYYHRFIWCDQRWGCKETQKDFLGTGGASEFRNLHHLERSYHEMIRYFGKDVVVDKRKPEQVRGRLAHAFQINLSMPW